MAGFVRTGSSLTNDLTSLTFDLPLLIPDFLYKQTVTMLAADPGIGKSIVSMQLAVSLSYAPPLFGTFPIPTPKRVYYLQLEGSYHQTIHRLRQMQSAIPLHTDNLCWDMAEGLNVLRDPDCLALEQRIQQFEHPDLIIIDPIYMAVIGGLSEDRPASAFVRFSNRLTQTFGCAVWLNHHTHRPRYQNGGKVEEDDSFYGSQWLKAHLDASWIMTRGTANNRVHLTCKKDRNSVLCRRIDLLYHEDSMTCERLHFDQTSAMTKVMTFLTECKRRNITTTISEIGASTGVSHAHLNRIKNEIGKIGIVTFVNSPGKSTCWIVT